MKKNKIFLITIDTEGDNQWDLSKEISTENSKYLPRFQELAEKFGFKPVWLTNYEMVNDEQFVTYIKDKQDKGLCEIGMHLHAWNNPPEYKLEKINNQRDYLIEYPLDIMEKKVVNLTELLTEKFGVRPVSHRSGRWTTNDEYFNILERHGYLIDCSVTPHVSWEKSLGSTGLAGSNYTQYNEFPYYIKNKLLEVPMTIRIIHDFQLKNIKKPKNLFGEIKRLLKGRTQWMRPDKNLGKKGLIDLLKKCNKRQEYVMFMIHSSELMPGGSPNFSNEESIEKLYSVIETVFMSAKKYGYVGMTLKEFYSNYQ